MGVLVGWAVPTPLAHIPAYLYTCILIFLHAHAVVFWLLRTETWGLRTEDWHLFSLWISVPSVAINLCKSMKSAVTFFKFVSICGPKSLSVSFCDFRGFRGSQFSTCIPAYPHTCILNIPAYLFSFVALNSFPTTFYILQSTFSVSGPLWQKSV